MFRQPRFLLIALLCLLTPIAQGQEEGKERKRKDRDAVETVAADTTDAGIEHGGEAEEECEVLLPSLTGTYEGKCKKGLAHGRGKAVGRDTYEGSFKHGYPHGNGILTYANGDVYDGDFNKGRMDGLGSLSTTYDGRDTVLSGIWVDGVYAGPKPKHPRVTYSYGVDSYSIKRARDGNRFLVDIVLNGLPNADLEDFTIVSTSGTQLQLGSAIGFENVTFPVTCKLSYKSWNKIRTSRHEVIFEFKIEDPGDWRVRIIN
jgi:hypothetical protein